MCFLSSARLWCGSGSTCCRMGAQQPNKEERAITNRQIPGTQRNAVEYDSCKTESYTSKKEAIAIPAITLAQASNKVSIMAIRTQKRNDTRPTATRQDEEAGPTFFGNFTKPMS
jgi:hypothetical protein